VQGFKRVSLYVLGEKAQMKVSTWGFNNFLVALGESEKT
jgi:hypothetical protein